MEPEVRKQPIRYYEIDLLRFLAALSVVFFHYTFRGYAADNYSPLAFPELGQVTRYGYLGVELFFIISGYVVLLSAQGKTVRQFVLSRITRLYPAFWVACTLTFVVARIWGPGPADTQMSPELHVGLGQYLYNMTMLQEFLGTPNVDGVYWTLTIEMTFYFLVSLLIAYRLMQHLDLCLALWLGYVLLPGVAHDNTPFATLLFPSFAPYFVAGMLFYLLQQPQGRTWRRYLLLAVAYLLAVHLARVQAGENGVSYHAPVSANVASGVVTLFFVVFYAITNRWISLSRFGWLAWLGTLTYPLYLLHSNIAFIAFHRLQQAVGKYWLLAGALASMLVAARLVHVFVEKRFSKLLGVQVQKWFARLDRSASQQAGT